MGRFAIRRIAQGLLVIIGVTIMVFIFTRLVGDPAKTMLPLSASAEQRAGRAGREGPGRVYRCLTPRGKNSGSSAGRSSTRGVCCPAGT